MNELNRRRWLAMTATMPLAAQSGLAGAATALPAPLERAATKLRQPERVAMLGVSRAGGSRIVAVGERGAVLISDDDARSWRQAAVVPVSVTLTAVQFVDARVGFAIGHQGVVLRSDDGGEHWARLLEGAGVAKLQLSEALALARPAAIADAERAVQEGADKPLFALHFSSASSGTVVGAFGIAITTTDGGKSWASIRGRMDNPKGAHLYSLSQRGQDLLMAGEQGLVLHSADAGRTFARISTPYQGSWFCAVHDADAGWLVAGLRGNAMRTTDGGRNWNSLKSPAPVGYTAALVNPAGDVLLANQGGDVVRCSIGSQDLVPLMRTAAQQPGTLLPLRDGSLLLAGWNGLTRAKPAEPGKG